MKCMGPNTCVTNKKTISIFHFVAKFSAIVPLFKHINVIPFLYKIVTNMPLQLQHWYNPHSIVLIIISMSIIMHQFTILIITVCQYFSLAWLIINLVHKLAISWWKRRLKIEKTTFIVIIIIIIIVVIVIKELFVCQDLESTWDCYPSISEAILYQ